MTELWLPSTVREPVKKKPTCLLCGQEFSAAQMLDYETHVGDCARAHAQEIHEMSEERRKSVFEPWDPEVADHMHKVGERMKQERRLEVKPSERAGF